MPIIRNLSLTIGQLLRCALLIAACAAAQAETRHFTLLVPDTTWAGAARPPAPADINVTVGSKRYVIDSIERFSPDGASPPIVVLDLGLSAPASGDCMLAELMAVLSHPHFHGPIRVFVTEGHPDAILRADFGWQGPNWQGAQTAILRPGRSLEAEVRACAEARTPERRSTVDKLGNYLNVYRLFHWLANTFPQSESPVRVFWVGDAFEWFKIPGEELGGQYNPNTASSAAEGISRADVTVSPILMPDRRTGQPRQQSRAALRKAEYFADWMGGALTSVQGPVGQSLGDAIAASERGYLLRLSGPPAGRKLSGRPPILKVSDRSGRVLFQRPFVVVEDNKYTEVEKPQQLYVGASHLQKILSVTAPADGSAALRMRVEVPQSLCSTKTTTLDFILRPARIPEVSSYNGLALYAARLGPRPPSRPPSTQPTLTSRTAVDVVCGTGPPYVEIPLSPEIVPGEGYNLVLHESRTDWIGVLEFERQKR